MEPANPLIYATVLGIPILDALGGLMVPVGRALWLNPARALGAE